MQRFQRKGGNERYLLFEDDMYYPSGGLPSRSFADLDEAMREARDSHHDYVFVYDRIDDVVHYWDLEPLEEGGD